MQRRRDTSVQLRAQPSEDAAGPREGGDVPLVALRGTAIAACSEDGSAFVWDVADGDGDTDSPQIIPHPNCVWKIRSLPNGDLITVCHDDCVCIFTTDAQRFAPPEAIAALDAAVEEARAK